MPYVIRHDIDGQPRYACGQDVFTTEPELAERYPDEAVEKLLEKVPDAFYEPRFGCGLVKLEAGE